MQQQFINEEATYDLWEIEKMAGKMRMCPPLAAVFRTFPQIEDVEVKLHWHSVTCHKQTEICNKMDDTRSASKRMIYSGITR